MKRPRRSHSFLVAASAACISLLPPAGAAHAHSTQLVTMSPPDGATITSARVSATLTYSAPVSIERLRIALPDGRELSPVVRTRGVDTTVVLPRPFQAGRATIAWQVPQGDGHVVEYERTYVYDESAIDPRIRIARNATNELVTAMRSALAAWR